MTHTANIQLKQKIKNTSLLSDEDKIAILAAMDGYEEADLVELEKIIGEFDAVHVKAVSQYKAAVYQTLDSLGMPQPAAQVKQGIDELIEK
jgi:hypothetical protein